MPNLRMEVEVKNPEVVGMTLNGFSEKFNVFIASTTRKEEKFIQKDNPSEEIKQKRRIIEGDKIELMGENEHVIKAYEYCIKKI